jgi:hypothetical protein
VIRANGTLSSLAGSAVAPAGYGKGSAVRDWIDVDLLEARRRIAALETERADANATINALLVRAGQLESQLDESERLFLRHLDRELERARTENARLETRIEAIYSSRWWALKRFVGLVLGLLPGRSRR